MPRIDDKQAVCRHCHAELPDPIPRVCPHCAGSLQKRFLSCGCLSSAPPALLLACAAVWSLTRDPQADTFIAAELSPHPTAELLLERDAPLGVTSGKSGDLSSSAARGACSANGERPVHRVAKAPRTP